MNGWVLMDMLFGASIGFLLGALLTAWFNVYIQGDRIDPDDT